MVELLNGYFNLSYQQDGSSQRVFVFLKKITHKALNLSLGWLHLIQWRRNGEQLYDIIHATQSLVPSCRTFSSIMASSWIVLVMCCLEVVTCCLFMMTLKMSQNGGLISTAIYHKFSSKHLI